MFEVHVACLGPDLDLHHWCQNIGLLKGHGNEADFLGFLHK
jgi:hypothetical protein